MIAKPFDIDVKLLRDRPLDRDAKCLFYGDARNEQHPVNGMYSEWYAEQPQDASLRLRTVSTRQRDHFVLVKQHCHFEYDAGLEGSL